MGKRKKRYPFEERTWIFDGSIEVERMRTGKPPDRGKKRAKRRKATPEEMAKQNQYNREKLVRRLIKENFGEYDHYATFTYRRDCRPPDLSAALEDRRKLLDALRKAYKKRGYLLKWIARTERGKRGAVHHHMIINRIPDSDRLLAEAWKRVQGSGRVVIVPMYERGAYAELAAYMVKPGETDAKGNPTTWSRYSHSRNLEVPQPHKDRTTRREIIQPPRPLPGYYIDPDSIRQGTNPITGREYLHFIMIKMRGGSG